MTNRRGGWAWFAAFFAAAGCASQPVGPAVAVAPGPGKPFIAFQQDDALCKQYSAQKVAAGASKANATAASVAAVGASMGAISGASFGTTQPQQAHRNVEQQYDFEYLRCMAARGDEVRG